MAETLRMHLLVEGRVQGVGFRYFVADLAVHLDPTAVQLNNRQRPGEAEPGVLWPSFGGEEGVEQFL